MDEGVRRVIVDDDAREIGLTAVAAWSLASAEPLVELSGLDADAASALLQQWPEDEEAREGHQRLLAALGYPATESAATRGRRTLAERGWRSYGAAVDAVQLVTLGSGLGLGLHRVAASGEEVTVRRARGGERLTPAFSSKSRPIPVGDLVYGIAADPFEAHAWLGKRDCDAHDRQLGPEDRQAYVIALGFPGSAPDTAERVHEMLLDVVTATGVGIQLARVAVEDPTVSSAGATT